MKKILSILTLALLTNCGTTITGYDFQTTATYQASNSKLQVDLISTGHVSAGADVGDGIAIGTITSSMITDTIYFQTSSTQLTALTYKKKNIEMTNPKDISGTLSSCLEKIGYINYDRQELKELGQVIKATTFGPKGTFLEGQTDLIKVINVNFERE